MQNFDYLRFYFQATTTNTTAGSVIVPVDEFSTVSGTYPRLTPGYQYLASSSSTGQLRDISYVSNTSIHFSKSVNINSSGNSQSTAVPTKIVGIKANQGNLKRSSGGLYASTYTVPTNFSANQTYTYDIYLTNNPNYKNLTKDDLGAAITYWTYSVGGAGSGTQSVSISSYDASSGCCKLAYAKQGATVKAGTIFTVFSPG